MTSGHFINSVQEDYETFEKEDINCINNFTINPGVVFTQPDILAGEKNDY